ncbi:hypothetical protein V7183_23540 [Bacillus sp. JJ1127]|uniref:hypothetical protein n=1 Tax=Bacillus sp. JJ1127 TaxID=3122952 RepID=UPI002FFE8506
MNVQYSHDKGLFKYKPNDYVTVFVQYICTDHEEEELFYPSTVTRVENKGFTCLIDKQTEETFFSFGEIENVIPEHLPPPFFAGVTRRPDKN